MPPETHTQEIDGYIITVWMTTVDTKNFSYLWSYTAMSNDAIYRGTVSASNRIDAVKEVQKKIETWTVANV
jgi:hypothetical protein